MLLAESCTRALMTLTALPRMQDKAGEVPHALLGAIVQQMLDLRIPVEAQVWGQAVTELQTRKRSILEVASLIIGLLRVCRCPMLLLIGEHQSPLRAPASSQAPADHDMSKGFVGTPQRLKAARSGCCQPLKTLSSQVAVSFLLRATNSFWLADETHCCFQDGDKAVLKDIRHFFKLLLQTGPPACSLCHNWQLNGKCMAQHRFDEGQRPLGAG